MWFKDLLRPGCLKIKAASGFLKSHVVQAPEGTLVFAQKDRLRLFEITCGSSDHLRTCHKQHTPPQAF